MSHASFLKEVPMPVFCGGIRALSSLLNINGPLICFLFLISVLMLPVPFARAQEIPSTVKPGVPERQFEAPVEPKSTPKIILPRPGEQPAPEKAEEIRLILGSLTVTGSTVFGDDELKAFYGRYLGEEVSLRTLYDVAAAITRAYGDRGFALCTAYVPAQEIDETGHADIRVVEGYIAQVAYTGDAAGLSPRNRRRLEALKGEKLLTVATLEKQVLLVNETAGLDISTTIDSAGEAGAVKLIVEADSKRFGVDAGVDNRGSKAQGMERFNIGGSLYGLLSPDDSLSVSMRQTFSKDELQYYSVGYSRLMSDPGTLLELGFTDSTGEPGLDILQLLEYENHNTTFHLGASRPLKRSRNSNFTLFSRFEINNTTSELLGIETSKQYVRSLRLGMDFDFLDRFQGQTMGRLVLSRGLDLFDATDNGSPESSRVDAEYAYTTLRADLYRYQFLGAGFNYLARLSGQFAPDPLPYSEQYGYGGNFFGRAYDASEVSGDSSLMAGIELRYRFAGSLPWLDSVEPYLFYSAGRTWIKDGGHDSAQDAGLGVRATVFEKHYVYMEWAKPLDHDVVLEENRDGRFFMGWAVSF